MPPESAEIEIIPLDEPLNEQQKIIVYASTIVIWLIIIFVAMLILIYIYG